MIGLLALATNPVFGSGECDVLAKEVKAQISSEPKKILVVVDAAIMKNTSCACEVVSAAISLVPDDKEMIREIVVTAVAAAPDAATRIAECAIASAPEASTEIAAGLDEVFEGAEAVMSAKEPLPARSGKEVIVDDVEVSPAAPVSVSGVYLIAPGGSSSVIVDGTTPGTKIVRRKMPRDKPKDKTTPPNQTPTDRH